MALTLAVREALGALIIDDQDQAAAELAITYAIAIDSEPEMIGLLGPRLLACLEALLMTPRARAAIAKGVNDDQRKQLSPLDELRQRRASRDC